MKYKGHQLTAQYLPGSNIRELKDGRMVDTKPKPRDLDHVSTVDLSTGEQLPNSATFAEAKAFITTLILLYGE